MNDDKWWYMYKFWLWYYGSQEYLLITVLQCHNWEWSSTGLQLTPSASNPRKVVCTSWKLPGESPAIHWWTYWCVLRREWMGCWGLLGWLLLVMKWIIPENSLRLAPESWRCETTVNSMGHAQKKTWDMPVTNGEIKRIGSLEENGAWRCFENGVNSMGNAHEMRKKQWEKRIVNYNCN